MNGFIQFLQLQKVDAARREVWGIAALEQPDRAREIMDYEKSLPNFLNWSRDMHKASGGLSHGNLRAMHRDVAAGKIIHLEPRDDTKSIYIGAKIVDDNEWKKVLEGVYTGFSVGGSYGAKWDDPVNKGYTRYEAKPVEISLVDVPCMPGAQFEVVKADGSSEMRKFVTVDEDLAKGDFEGHPFRGNQYTDEGGTIEHNGITYAANGKTGTHRMTGQKVRQFEDIQDRSEPVWVDEEGVVYDDTLHADELDVPKASPKSKSIGAARDQYLKENGGNSDGLMDHLKSKGYSQGEIDAGLNELHEDYTHNRNQPAIPNYTEQAMGMTEAEFNELDRKGHVKPWGVSEEGKAELERMRAARDSNFEEDGGSYAQSKQYQRRKKIEEKSGKPWQERMSEVKQQLKPEKIKGTLPVATRIVNAENDFVSSIKDQFGKTDEEARNILEVFKRNKVVKLDPVMGRYKLVHGAFWEPYVMDNALKEYNIKKSLSITDLLKGADMKPEELLNKLAASEDPAMQELAEELSKAFPPAKNEKGGDKEQAKPGGKPNPFDKSKEEDAAEEGETPEHEESETDEEEAQEEVTGEESDEQAAGEPNSDQTEAIRAVVIQLLEELGFVQEQGGQQAVGGPALKRALAGELQKRDGDLLQKLDGFTKRQDEITGDLVKLANALDAMEKRGGPAPIIRDLGTLGSDAAGVLQKAAVLRDLIGRTNDPVARQALQNELTVIEIKNVQTNK